MTGRSTLLAVAAFAVAAALLTGGAAALPGMPVRPARSQYFPSLQAAPAPAAAYD